MSRLRIGTRGSALALWQAKRVGRWLAEAHPTVEIDITVIRTRGDKTLDTPLHQIGGKGLFTREIEQALLDKKIDLAVHSLKDLPTEFPAGLALAAVPRREDPADAMVAKDGRTLATLPKGATVFTSSLRRVALLLDRRSDLNIQPIRGNVDTRLAKFDASDAAGIVFAAAGLIRLGLADRITERFDPATFIPACGQGALAVEARDDDEATATLLAAINDPQTRTVTTAERAFLAELGGGCQIPAGAWGHFDADALTLTAMVASPDGGTCLRARRTAMLGHDLDEAATLGRSLAGELPLP